MVSKKKEFNVWIVVSVSKGIVRASMYFMPSDKEYVTNENTWGSLKLGRDAFLTKREAVTEANRLKDKEIATLERRLAKLRVMTF